MIREGSNLGCDIGSKSHNFTSIGAYPTFKQLQSW